MEPRNEITYQNNELQKKCFGCFEDMKQNRRFCDITFIVGEVSVSAHRIIIAAAIPRFLEMLSDEDTQTEGSSISVPEIDPSVFESLIEYAYTCSVKINAENVKSLLIGACHLNLKEVRDACCDFMADGLGPENVLSVMDLAHSLGCSELAKICDRYVKENFGEVSQTENFLNRSLSYVRDIIGSDELEVAGEEKVYEAVINWVKHCPEKRNDDLPDLLKIVRMPLLEPTYLWERVAEETLIRFSIPCRDMLDKAKNYHYVPHKPKDFCTFATHARRYKKDDNDEIDQFDICAISAELSFKVQHLDSKTRKWRIKENETFYIYNSPVVSMCDKIYFFDWENICSYSPSEGDMDLSKRFTRGKAFSVKNNKLYVFGGSDGYSVFNIVECFDPESEEWSKISNMRERRSFASASTLGEFIYVLGGRNSESVLNSVEAYDCKTGKSSAVVSMLTPRLMFSSAVLKGTIYVCGGRISLQSAQCVSTAEMYDPASNQWKYISPMHSARRFFPLIACGGKLYAVGGQDDEGNQLNCVEVWDPDSDEWSFGNELNPDYVVSGASAFSRYYKSK